MHCSPILPPHITYDGYQFTLLSDSHAFWPVGIIYACFKYVRVLRYPRELLSVVFSVLKHNGITTEKIG
jgi:hypothetical protein